MQFLPPGLRPAPPPPLQVCGTTPRYPPFQVRGSLPVPLPSPPSTRYHPHGPHPSKYAASFFSSVQFNEAQFSSIQFCSVLFSSVQFKSASEALPALRAGKRINNINDFGRPAPPYVDPLPAPHDPPRIPQDSPMTSPVPFPPRAPHERPGAQRSLTRSIHDSPSAPQDPTLSWACPGLSQTPPGPPPTFRPGPPYGSLPSVPGPPNTHRDHLGTPRGPPKTPSGPPISHHPSPRTLLVRLPPLMGGE